MRGKPTARPLIKNATDGYSITLSHIHSQSARPGLYIPMCMCALENLRKNYLEQTDYYAAGSNLTDLQSELETVLLSNRTNYRNKGNLKEAPSFDLTPN